MEAVNLQEKLANVKEYWSPKIVGELNDSYVKVVKFTGEFVWHHHDHEDELFLVVKGRLIMQLRDKTLTIHPGEFVVIPRGVEHCPTSDEEVHIVLIEPAGILHSGGVEDPRAVAEYERI